MFTKFVNRCVRYVAVGSWEHFKVFPRSTGGAGAARDRDKWLMAGLKYKLDYPLRREQLTSFM